LDLPPSDFWPPASAFFLLPSAFKKRRPVINAKEVAVENRAEETYYHRTMLTYIRTASGVLTLFCFITGFSESGASDWNRTSDLGLMSPTL
jgi:hypothetical protein